MSLIWTRLLIGAMGNSLFGFFQTFTSLTRLGGLGDLGLGGALAVRVGQAIGRGDEDSLREFLPAARALLLLVGAALALTFIAGAPLLQRLLNFQAIPGTGSISLLFVTGGVGVFLFLIYGYFASINLAHGNISWPVIPTLFLAQVAMASHYLLASASAPLWIQNIGYVVTSAVGAVFLWWILRITHPWIGSILPLRVDRTIWIGLISTSGWMYLYSLGNMVYLHVDRLLINGGFGPQFVTLYQQNMKFSELWLQIILTAGAVSLSKLNRWIASGASDDRQKAVTELHRLFAFESMLGVGGACIYLIANDTFIRLWLGQGYAVPAAWQWAFALNMALTASGDACLQTSGLCGHRGIRNVAMIVGMTAALNFSLSFWAMKNGSIAGIAFATGIAQFVLAAVCATITSLYLGMNPWQWISRAALLPAAAVGVVGGVRTVVSPVDFWSVVTLIVVSLAVLVLFAYLTGFRLGLISHEIRNVTKIFRNRGGEA